MEKKYYILVGEDGYAVSKAINISGSVHQMIEVDEETWNSLDKEVIKAYRYADDAFTLDEEKAEVVRNPEPPMSEVDSLKKRLEEVEAAQDAMMEGIV